VRTAHKLFKYLKIHGIQAQILLPDADITIIIQTIISTSHSKIHTQIGVRERNSQLGITQEGKVKGPISFFQPELHSHSKPSSEALEALHVPCPQFINAHTSPIHIKRREKIITAISI
jgi:hypothetical protein